MKTREITINGATYPVQFTFQTILNFESLTGISFFEAPLSTLKNRIAMIFSAVITADEETNLTVEKIVGNQNWESIKEIVAAHNVILELSADFLKIPEIEKTANMNESKDEGKEKN